MGPMDPGLVWVGEGSAEWVKLRQFGIDVLTTGGDDTAQSRPVAWEPEVFARPEVRRVAAADNGAGELPPFA